MAEHNILRRVSTYLWRGIALTLALLGGLFLAGLQSCVIAAIWPSVLHRLLPVVAIVAGLATTGALVVIVARRLWRK